MCGQCARLQSYTLPHAIDSAEFDRADFNDDLTERR